MKERISNTEQIKTHGEFAQNPRSEFRDLVEIGAYKSLSSNEFFQGLQSEEQFDAMQSTLENCLHKREVRFYRLVKGKPDLAAQYRDQELKPLRNAMSALDEIAVIHGKDIAMQVDLESLNFGDELDNIA